MSAPNKLALSETEKVFAHHLGAFAEGLDSIMKDYSESSILITPDAEFSGSDAIKGFFKTFLDNATPEFWAAFTVQVKWVHENVAYLVWSAPPFLKSATDTLVIRDGRIAVQTFTAFVA